MPKKRTLLFLFCLFFTLLVFCCFTSRFLFQYADADFRDFSDRLFRQEVASNAITLHYTLKSPSDYGVEPSSLSLGSYAVSGAESCMAVENCLALLRAIPYQKLNEENQLTYRALEVSLEESLSGAPYTLYEEPMSPLTGVQSQLPVLLSEYQFYSVTDVDAYLALLKSVPEYFDSLIAFEQAKSDAHLFMAPYLAESLIDECVSFLNMGASNYLYSSFKSRLSSLEDCNESQKADYIRCNQEALEIFLFPSYQKLIAALGQLQDTGTNSRGLCHLPDGKAYYEYLACRETGSSRTVTELQTLTQAQMQQDLLTMQKLLTTASAELLSVNFVLEDSDPAIILADLQSHLDGIFPQPPKANTQIKFVQPEMEEFLSPAFYMVPAIDNAGDNTIYINPGHLPDDLTLFTTLAHEGYPGHLYQNTYYAATNPSPLRSLLGCGGYTEGWATYTEMISYYFTGLPGAQAALLQHNASLMLGLYALADMGIHYDGWSLADTIAFFQGYGISDAETIEKIYDLIVGDPANYLKYYIGYLELLELKKDAVSAWGDAFSQLDFHQAVLDAGPLPFHLLRDVVLSAAG